MKSAILRSPGLALALLLCACASGPNQLYEGERRPAGKESLLTITDPLECIRVGEHSFPSMFAMGKKELALLPGEHEVMVRFHASYMGEGGESQTVQSRAYALELELEPGGRYELDTTLPSELAEARAYAKRPRIWLTNLETGERIDFDLTGRARNMREAMETPRKEDAQERSAEATVGRSAAPQAAATPSASTPHQAPVPSDTSPPAPSAAAGESRELAELERWWARASDADRARFRERVCEAEPR